MYKTIEPRDLEKIKNQLPENTELWLNEEVIEYLEKNVSQEDIQTIKEVLYEDFLRRNPKIEYFG